MHDIIYANCKITSIDLEQPIRYVYSARLTEPDIDPIQVVGIVCIPAKPPKPPAHVVIQRLRSAWPYRNISQFLFLTAQ
jgi:hypothetical protein